MTGLFRLAADHPAPSPAIQRPRTHVYIDGYNFYYGAVKDTPHKWLDFSRLLRMMRPHDDILRIYYFTALVDAGGHRARQETYLGALATLPNFEIVLGKFLRKNVRCRVAACTATCDRFFSTSEEKRTDVNLAVYMLDDAYQNTCDRFILISGDSDLVPSVHRIKERFPQKDVYVYVPAKGRQGSAYELRASADRARDVPLNLLQHAQLPARVPKGGGGFFEKPTSW